MRGDQMDAQLWKEFWNHAWDSKLHELCCSAYTNKMRRRARIYSIAVIVVPAVAACLTPLNTYVPLAGCIVTSLLGILTKVQPLAVQSESELSKLNEFQEQFAKLCANLEDLFLSYRLESHVDNLEIKNKLKEYKDISVTIKPQMDKLVRKVPHPKKLNEQANEYANSKFQTVINNS